ncbi:hypothetical protein ACFWOJ_38200 [Streptomyces sp. NPDC058439]|uniref:hypothetical protein n=1 Tax=Streptomyces sp. NPDC058439 TaxID=3346500 RepID=UPI00365B760B
MGAAELGRELGDASGPLLVATIASLTSLAHCYAVLGVILALGPIFAVVRRRLAAG